MTGKFASGEAMMRELRQRVKEIERRGPLVITLMYDPERPGEIRDVRVEARK